MTQDSRAAFEEFYNKHYDNIDSEFAANMRRAWQASEQRILDMLDMLGSDEMVQIICEQMIGKSYKEHKENGDLNMGVMFSESCATAALQAISKKLGE